VKSCGTKCRSIFLMSALKLIVSLFRKRLN